VVITPFGDLALDDLVAEAAWVDAHERRHYAQTVAAKLSGGAVLSGVIDGDWMHRHWARTVALAMQQGIDLTGYTQALALPWKWRTEQELLDWHELHNRLHLKQDRQLGLI